jgi:hypothetical protein
MAWIKLDDGFPENPKVMGLSDRAFRLHVTALCHCGKHLTDGAITAKRVGKLAQLIELRRWSTVVTELVTARLWKETDNGWQIKDYTEYNLSKAEVDAVREKARERQRQFRLKRQPKSNDVTNGERNDVTSQGDVTDAHARGKDPEEVPSEPLGVEGTSTVSGNTAAADSARDAPPPPIEQVDLNGWADALRWVENDGWRLSSPQLAHRLVGDFGCNEPEVLERLVRVGLNRREDEEAS